MAREAVIMLATEQAGCPFIEDEKGPMSKDQSCE
jgi:hypothetical protein